MPVRINLKPPYKFSLQLLLIVLVASFSSYSLAADEVRYYDFEIIVFESNDQEARISEVWENTVQLEVPEKFIHLNSPYPGPMPSHYSPKHTFKRLPKSSYQLKQEAKLLTENNRNKILLHTSWRQPGMSSDTALPIHFKRNFITTISALPEQPVTDPTISPETSASEPPKPDDQTIRSQVTQSKSILEGYIRIILSRYLHADVNLTYTTGLPPASTSTVTALSAPEDEKEIVQAPNVFHLQQTRKMRSKEVHYLDHPVIGVIILATPYLGKTLKAR